MEVIWNRVTESSICLSGLFDSGRLAVTKAGEVRQIQTEGLGPILSVIDIERNYALTTDFVCQPSVKYPIQFQNTANSSVQIDSVEIRSIRPGITTSPQVKKLCCGRDLLWMWGITVSSDGNWFASFGEDEVITFDGDWGGYQTLIHLWQIVDATKQYTLVVDSEYARLSRDINTWDVRLSYGATYILISQAGSIECLSGVDCLISNTAENSIDHFWERYISDFELWSVGKKYVFIVTGNELLALNLQTGDLDEIVLPRQITASNITAINANANNSLYVVTNETVIYQGQYD